MRRIFLIIIWVSLIIPSALVYARNPFTQMLPKTDNKGQIRDYYKDKSASSEEVNLTVRVDGVFWGVEVPQAIIDGQVYKVGDKLKNSTAVITKIEKNSVTIIYKEKVFIFSPKGKKL